MNVLYLRTEFWFGLEAGGSVAHAAGVIRAMGALGHSIRVLSSDRLYGVTPESTTMAIVEPWRILLLPKIRLLGPLLYGFQLRRRARRLLSDFAPAIVYHRHGGFSAAGALLARRLGCPLVLEVNALVVRWAKEMSDPGTLRLAALARAVERFVFRNTTLFVAISDVVRDQLVEEGVEPDRIVVSPNGVDPGIFHPDVDPGDLRQRLGLMDRTVVGFIGTFGSWHGVEVLAQAVSPVVRARPDVHFLMIGDGSLRRRVEEIVGTAGVRDHVTFTGLVPSHEAPRHLAACDILVSPHSRPFTGRFIGSPTKLFEYMAMGRGIVASNLDQIGQVLEDGRSALLVEPDNVAALASGILRLAGDRELARRLGASARQLALDRYTWEHNVTRVLSALARVAPAAARR